MSSKWTTCVAPSAKVNAACFFSEEWRVRSEARFSASLPWCRGNVAVPSTTWVLHEFSMSLRGECEAFDVVILLILYKLWDCDAPFCRSQWQALDCWLNLREHAPSLGGGQGRGSLSEEQKFRGQEGRLNKEAILVRSTDNSLTSWPPVFRLLYNLPIFLNSTKSQSLAISDFSGGGRFSAQFFS